MPKDVEVLIEMKEKLTSIDHTLVDLRDCMRDDRKMMWRLLIIWSIGTFAVIGVKLAYP